VNPLDVILFAAACVAFALAAFGVASRINLIAAGLFCVALDFLLHALGVG
jgi:hypothetical protein